MNTLYLTSTEKQAFDALPAKLKEGWEVQEEEKTFTDTPKHRAMRMRFFRVHDPKLQQFYEDAKKCASEADLAALVLNSDLSEVNDADLLELFFVLGPEPLTLVIATMLQGAQSDTEIERISALSFLRHSLLSALQKK